MATDDFYTFVPKTLEVEKENTKTMFFGFCCEKEATNFLYFLNLESKL